MNKHKRAAIIAGICAIVIVLTALLYKAYPDAAMFIYGLVFGYSLVDFARYIANKIYPHD